MTREENISESQKFENTLISYVKEITDSWRVDTPFHTTKYWTFKHNGITYCVSRAARSFANETSYGLSQELGKSLYFGMSKQDLFSKIAEIMRS